MDEPAGKPSITFFAGRCPPPLPTSSLLALEVLEADVDPRTGIRTVRKVRAVELGSLDLTEGMDLVTFSDFEWTTSEEGRTVGRPTWGERGE